MLFTHYGMSGRVFLRPCIPQPFTLLQPDQIIEGIWLYYGVKTKLQFSMFSQTKNRKFILKYVFYLGILKICILGEQLEECGKCILSLNGHEYNYLSCF